MIEYDRQLEGKVRRFLLQRQRPDYVEESLARRRGDCCRCGVCCRLFYPCPLIGDDNLCTGYEPGSPVGPCGCQYPIDERDIADVAAAGGHCSYWFVPSSTALGSLRSIGGRRWVWIGDSILEGATPSIHRAYLASHPRDGVAIFAMSGWSTRRWQREGDIGAKVREYRPDVVVACLGTNDEGEERNRTEYERVIDRFKADASQTGARVLWVTSFSGPGSAERYAIVRGLLGDRDTISGLALMSGVAMSGEIHPTIAGYGTLTEHLLRVVWGRVVESKGGSVLVPLAVGAILTGAALWAAKEWG